MVGIISKPDTLEKLRILSTDAQYGLACACGSGKDEHRMRSDKGRWIYPVTLPNGGKSTLFKTLLSNVCANDCAYCPLRDDQDVRRCTLGADETARAFLDYYRAGEVFGLFLSSGVVGCADSAMERLLATVRILRRRYAYKGYVHLKVIPGASDAAIEEAVSLATAVSINIEAPGAHRLSKVSAKKDFLNDIVAPMKLISRLTGKGGKYQKVKQTTQFVVGAAGESDAEIVKYTGALYERLKLQRVYFSAFQRNAARGRQNRANDSHAALTREHRLYQVDFLLRKYGFSASDIICPSDGNLSLHADPKQVWADCHPELFPVNINRAGKTQLLKVPGLGPVTVSRILKARKEARLRSIDEIVKAPALARKAGKYVTF